MSVLADALRATRVSLEVIHRETCVPGNAVIDEQVFASRVAPGELMYDAIVADVRDQWTLSEADVELLTELIHPHDVVVEVGRLFGTATHCFLATGAKVISVDANAVTDWPIEVEFTDATVLRHQSVFAKAGVRRLILDNHMVNDVSHHLLADAVMSGQLVLVDDWFDATKLPVHVDLLFEDMWSFTTDDEVIASMLDVVDAGRVSTLVVHDVWRIPHVRPRLTAMLADRATLMVTWPINTMCGCALVTRR